MSRSTLMALLVGSSLMSTVIFHGKQFEFPVGTSQDQMEQVLSEYVVQKGSASEFIPTPDSDAAMRSENTSLAPAEGYAELLEGSGNAEVIQSPISLTKDQQDFAEVIAQVETGGLKNRSIRTKARPGIGSVKGSSAYGTYQITRGLLRGSIANKTVDFSQQELNAAQELMNRQEIGLAIGGRDRKNYQAGGARHGLAQRWAKQYGYENDVESFLNDFDYGGTYGLAEDADFQVLYESMARKLLNKTLKDAGGDVVQAAGVWHGGPKGAGASTEMYKNKVRRILGES